MAIINGVGRVGIRSIAAPAPTQSYLLDTYGGASVGFDFRKISSTATKCIRIRRSSDNTELDIGFSGEIVDTLAITTFVGSNSAYVVKWYDQSGNGYDLSQTNASIQPRIVNAGIIYTQNGKVSMEYFTNGNKLITSHSFSMSTPIHTFITAKNTRANNEYPYFFDSSLNRAVIYYSGINLSLYNGGHIDSTYSGTDFNILTGLFNGASSKLRRNSTQIATGNAGNDGLSGLLYLGSRNSGVQSMYGSMSSFIIYSSNQSANQSAIETEINSYYSIY